MGNKKGMTCERVELLLGAFVDGELNRSQTAAVRRHLCGCLSCSNALTDLEKLNALVTDATEVSLPPAWHDSVMRVVHQTKRTAKDRPSCVPAWRRFATVTACGLCLVVVALALITGGGDKVMMEGLFDANTSAPDASDSVDPPYDKSESVSDSGYGDWREPMTPDAPMTPDIPESPNEPAMPDAPLMPDLPSADETLSVYVLRRADGGTTDGLDGEWVGETMRLSVVAQTGEIKIAYSGESEARLATYGTHNGVLKIVYDDGSGEAFDYICKEGELWLTRQ
jgi:hypothetical protein